MAAPGVTPPGPLPAAGSQVERADGRGRERRSGREERRAPRPVAAETPDEEEAPAPHEGRLDVVA
jgi:hypothetical protein